MLAAKAARMKCVVVPHTAEREQAKWGAADLQINSLEHFTDSHLQQLS
jgi:sugar-phosphatase